jgi:hypothetical protein
MASEASVHPAQESVAEEFTPYQIESRERERK